MLLCRRNYFVLLMVAASFSSVSVQSAENSTRTGDKALQFSGWKPLTKPEALSTTQFAARFGHVKPRNSTDSMSEETRRSFLLVYPPRTAATQDQPQKSDNLQQNDGRNTGPPLRTYPTQSRYHRMMNFGIPEGPVIGNKRPPSVYQRPKFPPVANPPPLPEHAVQNKQKLPPKFTPESTSQHQVQIQLLDGYIVPPSQGVVTGIRPQEKGQIATFPLNLNNVPEIRLLLPGDVHEQLNNLQRNRLPRRNPERHRQAAFKKEEPNPPRQPLRDFNNADKVPNHSFESKRYPDSAAQKTNNNHNTDGAYKNLAERQPQQQRPNYNSNFEQRRPLDDYSQPDPVPYPDVVTFPGQNNFREPIANQVYNNQGNNFESQNYGGNSREIYSKDPVLDARAPVGPTNIQSFSNTQLNTNVQSNLDQQRFTRPGYNQDRPQNGNFVSQNQRGYPREQPNNNFNQNYNQQIQTVGVPGEHNQNGGFTSSQNNNGQYGNTRNFDQVQNGWVAAKPSDRGKQNYNRVLVPPAKQNFYTVDSNSKNHNTNHQGGAGGSPQSPDLNIRGINDLTGDKNGFTQTNSVQDDLQQKIITDAGAFVPTQSDNVQTSTDGGIIVQQKVTDIDSSDSPGDQVYFIPPVPNEDDVQTQIQVSDVQTSIDTSVGTSSEVSENAERGDGVIIEQKEFQPGDGNIIESGSSSGGTSGQQDTISDRTGFCECTLNCAPIQRSPDENFGTTVREIARSLSADAFFEFVGLTDEQIENLLTMEGQYTLFIPSNEAVSRLPSNLVDHWRENNPDFTMALLNHVVPDVVNLDQLKQGGRMMSRANDATLFINNYNNEAVTVNGHRIVHGDVVGPKGGTIHVIDGTLCPVADQDIINTLRTCNKYDGFLTLADVTKLLDTMQDEGPYTVFLPSNDALTKIPADELSVLKENVTVLREFLEYHIVQGAYFSGDLKDGQYLTTLYQRQPVRVGVRVDGCYRRLVEANNSPLFKSDIPTKNGVIHVIDWVLRPADLNWCDGVILP